MDATQIVTAAIALLGTLAGIAFTAWKFRRSQKSTDSTSSYDQIQEDLKEMRAERSADRAAAIAEREKDRHNAELDRREMSYMQQLLIHLDNEVVQLRSDIQIGVVPPLKPRPPMPQRPDRVAVA